MLAEVFGHATSQRFDIADIGSLPFVMTQVCRGWRIIAQSQCPRLWACFSLRIPEKAQANLGQQWEDRLSAVLTRSRKYPLDILYDHCYENEEGSRYHELLWPHLRNTRQRWLRMRLSLPARHIPSLFSEHFPILRECEVHCVGMNVLLHLLHINCAAPLLQRLELLDFCPQLLVHWTGGQLLHYNDNRSVITEEQHDCVLDTLALTPTLEVFHVHYQSYGGRTWRRVTPPITCPNLRTFSATDENLIESVQLVNAHTVLIGTGRRTSAALEVTVILPALQHLIQSATSSLTHLSLFDVAIDQDLLLPLFQVTTSLTWLSITFSFWNAVYDEAISALFDGMLTMTFADDDKQKLVPLILPKLTGFHLKIWDSRSWHQDADFVGDDLLALIWGRPNLSIYIESHTPKIQFAGLSDTALNLLSKSHTAGHDVTVITCTLWGQEYCLVGECIKSQ